MNALQSLLTEINMKWYRIKSVCCFIWDDINVFEWECEHSNERMLQVGQLCQLFNAWRTNTGEKTDFGLKWW